MASIARRPKWMDERDNFCYQDDFFWLVTAHMWTTLVADTTPTVTVPDARGGLVKLFTDTTDNNEVAIRTTCEPFLPADGKPCWCAGRIQYAENDTNKANVFFGFASAIGANLLVDNGAGMRTSGSIAAIYKVDGGTVWRCHSRDNAGATDTVSTTTAGGTADQELEIEIMDYTSTGASVVFKCDGVILRDSNNNQIRHTMAYASLTEMNFGIYVKSGGGAGGETLYSDWIGFGQER